MVLIKLTLAMICFQGQCYPALVGRDTPIGNYQIVPREVLEPGYQGEVLQFKEDVTSVFSIHRIWLGSPKEHRMERIQSSNPKDRTITHGCVNVTNQVYAKLRQCCSNDKLIIEK